MPHVTLQYFDGCPSWQTTDQRLRDLADELGFTIAKPDTLSLQMIDTCEAGGVSACLTGAMDAIAERVSA